MRIALGAIALVGGAAGGLAVVYLARGVTYANLALAPWKALAAVLLVLAFTALFAALGTMGWRRVVAGIRGHAALATATSLVADDLRVFVSARTRRLLAAFVVGMLVCALTLAGLGGAAAWLAFVFLGTAVASGAILAAARTPEHSCSFCGALRAGATWLVAGESASICDHCIQKALGEFAKHFASRGETSEWCNRFLRALPNHCPRAISRPFIERIAAGGTAAEVRNAVWWCFELGNEPFARHLLELIPEAERQPHDWLNLGVALGEEGRLGDALEATTRAQPGGDEHRAWVINNSVWFRSRMSPEPTADELTAWLRDVEEAKRLTGAREPATSEPLMPYLLGTEAELRRMSGDLEGAMQALERAAAEQPLTGAQLFIRAQVLAALGRHAEARASLERAVSLLHPEELMVKEAQQMLATLAQ